MLDRARLLGIWFASASLFAAPVTAQFPAYMLSGSPVDLAGFDPTTGQSTIIGPVANANLLLPTGLDWKDDPGELWVLDGYDGDIGRLAEATGQFTLVASLGLNRWSGLTWDPATQRFYLTRNNAPFGPPDSRLYSFDPTTSSSRLIGNLSSGIFTLDVDANGVLWGISAAGLFQIDKRNARSLYFCSPPASNALGIHPDSGRFYISYSRVQYSSDLGELDPLTGLVTSSTSISGGMYNFTFVDGICPGQPHTYGSGCPGSGGYLPLLDLGGCIGAGRSARIALSNVITGSTAFAFFGTGPGDLPLGDGCALLVAAPFSAPILPIAILGTGGSGRGFGVLEVPIPPFVTILPFAMQAAVFDRGVARGYALSNGVRVEVR